MYWQYNFAQSFSFSKSSDFFLMRCLNIFKHPFLVDSLAISNILTVPLSIAYFTILSFPNDAANNAILLFYLTT